MERLVVVVAAKSLLNATKDQIEALKKKGTLIEMETKDE
jgi:hypothetical protein